MKKIFYIFLVTFALISLFQVCYGYNANDNVILTTGSDINNTFEVDILPAFVDNNINFNDWSLSYYFSYKNGNTYEFYVSSDKFQVGSNGVMKTIGANTLWFSYENSAWTYNTFYGPSANIGNYNFNAFYFLNDGFLLGLNASNFSVNSEYFQVDITITPDEPGEDTGIISGILSGIRDFFVNLFIPTNEMFEDLKDNFTDNILSKFNIINISRGNVSYDNNDVYEYTFADQLPVFDILGYQFKGQMLYDFMHTPISFGYLEKWKDNYTQWVAPVQTSGITAFDIINLLFGISITAMNITLYNKFFEKE